MTSAIRTNRLVKNFGRNTALRGLDLNVLPGSAYALVGPNGAGKTTAIKVILNIIRATGGNAEVLGIPSSQIRGLHFESIGYVSENQELPDWMTGSGFLRYRMEISESAVKNTLQQLFGKDEVRTWSQLVRVALERYRRCIGLLR